MPILKVYLIARISSDAHAWNKLVCESLTPDIQVFLPQEHNPWNKLPETFSKNVFEVDLKEMKDAHLALILPDYGNDCAFEVGWFHGAGKPVVCFVEHQTRWLKDWMVKGGITHVVTTMPDTYQTILNDPFFNEGQVFLLPHLKNLSEIIIKAHMDSQNAQKHQSISMAS